MELGWRLQDIESAIKLTQYKRCVLIVPVIILLQYSWANLPLFPYFASTKTEQQKTYIFWWSLTRFLSTVICAMKYKHSQLI